MKGFELCARGYAVIPVMAAIGGLGVVSILTSCARPLETMEPPEWAKEVPGSSGSQVVVSEPELVLMYVESDVRGAEIVLDLAVRVAGADQPARYAVPMKRQLVRGEMSLPSLNVIGDAWDPEGNFTGATHISYELLEVTADAARVAVDTWWTDRDRGEGRCGGELVVRMGSMVHKAFRGGCEVTAHFRHPNERSNYPLPPPAGVRCGVV